MTSTAVEGTQEHALAAQQEATALVERTKYLGKSIEPTLARLAEKGIQGRRLMHLVRMFNPQSHGAHAAIKFPLETMLKQYSGSELTLSGTEVLAFEGMLHEVEDIVQLRQDFDDRGYSISYEAAFTIYRIAGERAMDLLDQTIDVVGRQGWIARDRTVIGTYKIMLETAARTGYDPEQVLHMRMASEPDQDPLDRVHFEREFKQRYPQIDHCRAEDCLPHVEYQPQDMMSPLK